MDRIEVYAFETRDGAPDGDWTTQDIEEARAYARSNGLRILAHVFEFSTTEYVEDFTHDDDDDTDDDDTEWEEVE